MIYCYDGQLLHTYICHASGIHETAPPDLYAGIGKIVKNRLVGAFTLRGLAGKVYEFSGAVTNPRAMRGQDYATMLRYLAKGADADAVIAFTNTRNLSAQRFLNKMGFIASGRVMNYYGAGKDAVLYQMDLDRVPKLIDNFLKSASARGPSCANTSVVEHGLQRTQAPSST